MTVMSLAYLGLGIEDSDRWIEFAVEGLGLGYAGLIDGAHRLRMDDVAWRIALHPSEKNDVLYAGFDVADAAAAQAIGERFESRGIVQRSLTHAEARERGVSGGIVAQDPDGLRLEFVHGSTGGSRPFEPHHVDGFVTGDNGLGHVVLSVGDPLRSAEFYALIGFSVSDYIDLQHGANTLRITFLHCNKRHHTVALAPRFGPRLLDHLMIEVATADEVINTYNRLLLRGFTMKRHLGRHSNDRMLSFYVTTPAGFDLEFGCEGIEIAEQWQVKVYDRISVWGHHANLAKQPA